MSPKTKCRDATHVVAPVAVLATAIHAAAHIALVRAKFEFRV